MGVSCKEHEAKSVQRMNSGGKHIYREKDNAASPFTGRRRMAR